MAMVITDVDSQPSSNEVGLTSALTVQLYLERGKHLESRKRGLDSGGVHL